LVNGSTDYREETRKYVWVASGKAILLEERG
jgi:hypothetical protein